MKYIVKYVILNKICVGCGLTMRCFGCMEHFEEKYAVCPFCGRVVASEAEESVHIQPGTLLHGRFVIGYAIGYGGFGVTYIAWDQHLEQRVAVKEYLPTEFSTRMPGRSKVSVFNGFKRDQFYSGLKNFVDEAKILAKFQNEEGIVKVFDSFEENGTAYIIMEYLEGETLSTFLKKNQKLTEEQAIQMLTPVISSLGVVHGAGIIHRDIAPDNIFLTTDGKVKLIDFGASRYATTSHSKSLTVIIKQGYSPEEQYRSNGDQGPHTDVYSIAATIYKMLTGETPPDAMERRGHFEKNSKDILVPPHKINKKISPIVDIALLNALNVRVQDRTPDTVTFLQELKAKSPAKRRQGNIKKIDLYHWPLWIKILIPVIMVVLISVGALLVSGVIDFSRFTEEIVLPDGVVIVPDVEGLQVDEAISIVEEKQLNPTTGGSIQSDYIPAGKIILQDPIGDSYLEINGTVVLTVSSGKGVEAAKNGISTMPHVIWDTKEDAVAKLLKAGFGQPKFVEEYDDVVAVGSVISADIETGAKVDEGTVVTIKISKGPKSFDMPDVTGQDGYNAKAMLESKGLKVSINYVNNKVVPEGSVVSQSIEKGNQVKRGDVVVLSVSSGKPVIVVSDVCGYTKGQAKTELESSGFDVEILTEYSDSVPEGQVIRQEPAGGTTQLADSTILLYVSKGAETVRVPDVVGDDYYDAVYKLESNGLYVDVTYEKNDNYDENHVIRQSIEGGNNVTKGTSVSIVVSSGRATVVVADVVGHTKDNAVSTLSNQGFDYELYERYDNNTQAGYVISQSPEAGTAQLPGSTIVVYVSKGKQSVLVSFDTNGGSVSQSDMTVYVTEAYGQLPVPSRPGYSFDGWTTSDGSIVTSSTNVSTESDHTLYAKWSVKSYKLYFDSNGSSSTYSARNVAYGSGLGSLPSPQRSYYNFTGWYTSAYGGTKVTSSTQMPDSDMTIYAQWSEKTPSDWVREGSVPYNAQITDTKYTYTQTLYKTSSSSSMSGWTLYDTKKQTSPSGSWSSYSTTPVYASDTKEVRTTPMFRYYYFKCNSCGFRQPYKTCEKCGSSAYWHEYWTTTRYTQVSYTSYGSAKYVTWNIDDGERYYFESDALYLTQPGSKTSNGSLVVVQGYSWRPLTTKYTYYYKKTSNLESSSYPSGSDISNIVKWVKYREP